MECAVCDVMMVHSSLQTLKMVELDECLVGIDPLTADLQRVYLLFLWF